MERIRFFITPVNPTEPTWNVLIVTDAPERISALEGALRARSGSLERVPSCNLGDTPLLARFTVAFVEREALEGAAAHLRPLGIPIVAVGDPSRAAEVLAAVRLGARDVVGASPSGGELEAVLGRLEAATPTGSAWIEYQDARGEDRRLRLSSARVTFGRDASSDVRFEASTVSRFHAEILAGAEGHRILDSGSRHGVFVNGVRVREQILRDGDQIRLGGWSAPVVRFHGRGSAGDLATAGPLASLAGASHRELKHLAALLDAFLSLKGDLRLEDILQIVIDSAMELVDADRGMILLLERAPPSGPDAAPPEEGGDAKTGDATAGEATSELRLAMARRRDGAPLDATELQISRKIPEDVIRTGCGAILEDLLAPEQLPAHQGTIEIGVRSAMCVPLLTRRTQTGPDSSPQVLGVLYVDSASKKSPYSPRLLEAFESLASEAAQAIFNARMYKLSLEKRRIDEEMRIARTIQQSFLPPADHRGEWFVLYGHTSPSLEVGGDFFSYYPQEGERLGFVVGDVSGKGIPAAIFAAFLDGVSYGLAAGTVCRPELQRLAGVLNRYLVTRTAGERFVSLVFAVLLPDGRLSFVNAGHNPPLRIGLDGGVEKLVGGGMILGMLEDADYEVKEIVLAPGDTLVLCSDGITEAGHQRGEAFGWERLRDAAVASRHLGAREVHAAILGSLEGFLDGERPTDDVTLLVVKYR